MKQKELLAHLLTTMLDDGFMGVEIGVDRAETTQCILEQCPKLRHLYAVDPYFKRSNRYKVTKELLDKYDKCSFLRMTSDEAVSYIPDNLDFVFIDGDHSYLAVKSDLNNYVPKIKSGGLLIGHDWTSVRSDFGVVKAAEEYLNKNSNLFKPLFTNEQLLELNLASFKRGGWSKITQRHLIHKKRPSAFPLWWVIKA